MPVQMRVRYAETRPQAFYCTQEKAGQRSMLHATSAQHNGLERKLSPSLVDNDEGLAGGLRGTAAFKHRGVGRQRTAMSQSQGLIDKSVSVASIARAEDAQRAASPESEGGRRRAIRGGEKMAGPATEGCWW